MIQVHVSQINLVDLDPVSDRRPAAGPIKGLAPVSIKTSFAPVLIKKSFVEGMTAEPS